MVPPLACIIAVWIWHPLQFSASSLTWASKFTIFGGLKWGSFRVCISQTLQPLPPHRIVMSKEYPNLNCQFSIYPILNSHDSNVPQFYWINLTLRRVTVTEYIALIWFALYGFNLLTLGWCNNYQSDDCSHKSSCAVYNRFRSAPANNRGKRGVGHNQEQEEWKESALTCSSLATLTAHTSPIVLLPPA